MDFHITPLTSSWWDSILELFPSRDVFVEAGRLHAVTEGSVLSPHDLFHAGDSGADTRRGTNRQPRYKGASGPASLTLGVSPDCEDTGDTGRWRPSQQTAAVMVGNLGPFSPAPEAPSTEENGSL